MALQDPHRPTGNAPLDTFDPGSTPNEQPPGGTSAAGQPPATQALALVRSALAYLVHLKETGVEGLPADPRATSGQTLSWVQSMAQPGGEPQRAESPSQSRRPSGPGSSLSAVVAAAAAPSPRATADSNPAGSVVPSREEASPFHGQQPTATPPRDKQAALKLLAEEEIGDCRRCSLCHNRQSIVIGRGNPDASILFVGAGPGPEDDEQGTPFAGPAGALLDRIIAAMGLTGDAVYLANVVKCRPPNDRHPSLDEILACQPFLMQQIDLVSPSGIIALGEVAAKALLRSPDSPLETLRNRWHMVRGIPLRATYHPAYLLNNPGAKKACWRDIQQVMVRLGLSKPA